MDLWPLIKDANHIDPQLLLALCQAESGLNPRAVRQGVFPDWSAGLTQISVPLAAAYGIGNGQATSDNWQTVCASLFSRSVALDVGARYLADCLTRAGGDWLLALRLYNAGEYGRTESYAEQYAANIASYQRALAWAESVLAGG